MIPRRSGVADVTLQHKKSTVKINMLGASVGPQLFDGRGLCNFWAKINSAGGELHAGRQVFFMQNCHI